MKSRLCKKRAPLLFVLWFVLTHSNVLAASLPDAATKSKQEEKYISLSNHDEIVAGAKTEGRLRLLGTLNSNVYKMMISAFRSRYPFVTDVYVEDITGNEAKQRFLLELKAGRAPDWDIFDITPDFWNEYLPFVKRFDILGMAIQKVLAIPAPMIDPKNRNIVSTGSSIFVVGYNRKLLAEEKVPRSWEDFLKPEFKGRKFMVDALPRGFASLAAGLGEKAAVHYAERIAAQEPVWTLGQSRSLTAIVAGEQAMLHFAYYHTCQRAAKKDSGGSLECKVIEPVPVRIQEFAAVNNTAPRPYTGLLWLEFQASPEGQKIIENFEPMNTSIYVPDSALAKAIQGKKLLVNNFDTLHNTGKWEQMTLKAFGFPKVEETNR
jgi:ABC-type Fe3+ transport system substrate-binding protein